MPKDNNNIVFHLKQLLYVFLVIVSTSCSLTKGLDTDENVYCDTTIKVIDGENANSVDHFSNRLKNLPRKGSRTGIGNILTGFHNIYKSSPEKGFKHWVKYKLGEAPAVFEEQQVDITKSKIVDFIRSKGFYSSEVNCESVINNRKVIVDCSVRLGTRYKIDSIIYPDSEIYNSLLPSLEEKKAVLKPNDFYDRDKLDFERTRISILAGSNGYYNFNTSNIFYFVDTISFDKTLDLYPQVLIAEDSSTLKKYVLDKISVYTNYSNRVRKTNLSKSMFSDSIYILEQEPYLSHKTIKRMILEDINWYYNKHTERKTIARFSDLGIFKSVNISNDTFERNNKPYISQNIFLTPAKLQSISGEVEINNRSGNFFGTGASVKCIHRNLFGRAESLDVNFGGQVETQFGEGLSVVNSSDLNLNLQLAVPRIIMPFLNIKEGRNFIPRTLFNANLSVQRRAAYYTLRSIQGRFGYRWKETASKQHEIFPLSINQLFVINKTTDFEALLNNDARLAKSFEDVLIMGMQYNYTYTSQSSLVDNNYSFLKTELETSGNFFGLFSTVLSSGGVELAGRKLAQFTKFTVDYRRYLSLGESSIAGRIVFGAGLAYGNKGELPYIKQYLIGGSNSLRAFRLRGLGPGLYVLDPSIPQSFNTQFVDQTGDMKIEFNVEYRFPIFSYLKGALFVDAGNIWLINNPDRPEGNFSINKFYKEIALGTGFGFRLDFNFFLIRLDMAFPIRKPVFGQGFRWTLNDVDLLSSQWRGNNIRFNLGIGYPF